jgi:hypothetical protein
MICNNSNLLLLSPIEPHHLPQIQKWRNLSSIQGFVREYRELSMGHINKWYESIILDNRFEFFLIENNHKKPIGITGLTYIDWVNKNADLHLAIYEHGWIDDIYAPEAFDIIEEYGFNYLNLHKIYAEIYEIDKKKINLFVSKDYKKDAVLRDHCFYKGKFVDSLIYSKIK